MYDWNIISLFRLWTLSLCCHGAHGKTSSYWEQWQVYHDQSENVRGVKQGGRQSLILSQLLTSSKPSDMLAHLSIYHTFTCNALRIDHSVLWIYILLTRACQLSDLDFGKSTSSKIRERFLVYWFKCPLHITLMIRQIITEKQVCFQDIKLCRQ